MRQASVWKKASGKVEIDCLLKLCEAVISIWKLNMVYRRNEMGC